jgi:prepilin-type N-terminal cleavage/methylation domain-containing protein
MLPEDPAFSQRHRQLHVPFAARRAFSLIELVIVVVIIGVISSIAVPRMLSAAETARANALKGSLSVLNKAAELYAAEHDGKSPAHDESGTLGDASAMIKRLVGRTKADGTIDANGAYGPYLREMPLNPYSKLLSVRIDGAASGAGTNGWRFDAASNQFMPDDADGNDLIRTGKVRIGPVGTVTESVTTPDAVAPAADEN